MFPFLIVSLITRKAFAYIPSPLRSNNIFHSFAYMTWPVVLQTFCFQLFITVDSTQVFIMNLDSINDFNGTGNYAQI